MKTYAPFFIAIASIFSVGCFAQGGDSASADTKMGNMQLMSDALSGSEPVVVAYHVEERINSNFGSHITTYNVSSLSLVGTSDLGPNNTRVVTPIFGKEKEKAVPVPAASIAIAIPVVAVNKELPKAPVDIIIRVASPVKANEVVAVKRETSVKIDIISTYERVLEKGYQSVDMLKRVGNSRYFDGDLVKAAKWYTELFSMTTDLDAAYYYRYAQSLKAVNQNEKAKEMMAIFESKNL
jgi:hypothetical protein